MKASHDEERKRWAEREETITKIETVHKELETNYKKLKPLKQSEGIKLKSLLLKLLKRRSKSNK